MSFQANSEGYFGTFGGAYIPEMLFPNIEQLQKHYKEIISSDSFQANFKSILKDYVGRPTPLTYAERLSEKYGYNIFLKREDLCHTGAHKINNTVGQILLAKELGKKKIIAETGAGQHGVATATVCAMLGFDCLIYMGLKDMQRQKPNVDRMKMLGATIVPAEGGTQTLKDATNDAMRHWIEHPEDTHYIIGSVIGPHPYPDMVARFQSVISEEIKKQFIKGKPNAIIACVGGGSNAAGAFYHFLEDKDVHLIAVEAAGEGIQTAKTAASLALGKTGILHGCKTIFMQDDDGQVTEPHSVSAGLDYPGVGPLHAHLKETKRAAYLSATDEEAIQAAFELTKYEGIIPALETAHALAVLPKVPNIVPVSDVVLCLSGRGDKDFSTYEKHL